MRKAIISLLMLAALGLAKADTLQLQDNHPNTYTVRRGDTLWDISGKFLKQPWRWPEIWNMNRDEIKNPHWIYPGDLIVLDMVDGQPRLSVSRGATMKGGTIKIRPQVRIEGLDGDAIPTIASSIIDPFLSQPKVITNEQLLTSPRIGAGGELRVVFGAGDYVYAEGLEGQKQGSVWQIYRQGKALKDPADKDEKIILGHEALYLGDARLDVVGKVSKLTILRAEREITYHDRLLAAPEPSLRNYQPHAPSFQVNAQVVSSYGDMAEVGQYFMVVLNKGALDGLEVGHVLQALKAPRLMQKVNSSDPDLYTLPEVAGEVMVFRVFDHLSYALVMRSTDVIKARDVVVNP